MTRGDSVRVAAMALVAAVAGAQPVLTPVPNTAGFGGFVILRYFETGGAAWLDYDRDGWVDLFLTNGQGYEKGLFHNEGDGTFILTTGLAGLGDTLDHDGHGVCYADFDADGDDDLLLAGTPTLFFTNDGDGTFADASDALPMLPGLRANSAYCAFFDGDDDTDLDLVIGQDYGNIWYVPNSGGAFGVGTTWPIAGEHTLALDPVDFDNDGDQDVFVVNDYTPDWLMRNDGKGSFTEIGSVVGINTGNFKGCGMGIDHADLNGDGWFDFFISDYFSNSALLISNGAGGFSEQNLAWNIDTTPTVGWGLIFADFDNDGDDDLFMSTSDDYPNQWLYVNAGDGSFDFMFVPIERLGGGGIGAIAADYDNDGDLDVMEAHLFGVPTLLRNDSPAQNWLRVAPIPDADNPGALGVRVTLEAGGQTWMREITGNISQQSQTEPIAHFGLGSIEAIDSLAVRWPSGDEDVETDLAINQVVPFPRGGFPEPDAGVPDMGLDAGGGAQPDAGGGGGEDAGSTTGSGAGGCGCAIGSIP